MPGAQVSAAKVLLGADIALEPREAPPAFSSAPLAEIPGSAAEGADGEGVSTAAAVDADSSTPADSSHGNGGKAPPVTGNGVAQESAPKSKIANGPTTINIIPPDSRFPKPASTTPVIKLPSLILVMNS